VSVVTLLTECFKVFCGVVTWVVVYVCDCEDNEEQFFDAEFMVYLVGKFSCETKFDFTFTQCVECFVAGDRLEPSIDTLSYCVVLALAYFAFVLCAIEDLLSDLGPVLGAEFFVSVFDWHLSTYDLNVCFRNFSMFGERAKTSLSSPGLRSKRSRLKRLCMIASEMFSE